MGISFFPEIRGRGIVKAPTRAIKFRNSEIIITQTENGDWIDDLGTIYPNAIINGLEDFCGPIGATTGTWDPYYKNSCSPHDHAFMRLKLGHLLPGESNASVNANFAKETTVTALKGLYAFVTFPFYLIAGAGIGMIRWAQLEGKK